MNIILFGPPGAGKGTQAQHIVKKFNYFQIADNQKVRISHILLQTYLRFFVFVFLYL